MVEDCFSLNREPSNQEIEAEYYVLNKVMVRPPVFPLSFGFYIFAFLYSVVGVAFVIFCLSRYWLINLSNGYLTLMNEHPGVFCFATIVISFFITLALFSKRILIWLVHIYQHYAPEHRRRMCLFKPTCSEYAILALNKYGSIQGTLKTVNRLRRCKGNKYRIDYP